MENIREIFEENIKMIGFIDRALIFTRQCRYDKALYMLSQTGDGINVICDAIVRNPDYFGKVSTDSISEMLKGILDARRKKDYVLLADLYDLQVMSFITNVQQIILEKEDFLDYTPQIYTAHIEKIKNKVQEGLSELQKHELTADIPELQTVQELLREDEFMRLKVNLLAELDHPLEPEFLLDKGYSVEFTSCGLLTLQVPFKEEDTIYLHTNSNIIRESFLLAQHWTGKHASTYIVFGFGMGYHIAELALLKPDAQIIVYESDPNVLKLYAAFSDGALLNNDHILIVLDPEKKLIERRLKCLAKDEEACVHYPSMRRSPSGPMLSLLVPWGGLIEDL